MSEEVYPVEASLLGNNTQYVKCEFRERQQNYAICLNTIKAFDEGRRKEGDICCSEIKKKICPAFKMRQEELSAGHTLYYTPRVKVEVVPVVARVYETPQSIKRTDGYQRGYAHAGGVIHNKSESVTTKRIVTQPKTTSVVVKKPEIIDGSMASVVSQIAKDHAAGVAVAKVEKEVVVFVKDVKPESVLEKARRIRESRGVI